MSNEGLNEIVGLAAISDSFCDQLLHGRRAECLQKLQFPLDDREREAVMAIQATELKGFSIAVMQLIARSRGASASQLAEPVAFQPIGWPSRIASGAFILHE